MNDPRSSRGCGGAAKQATTTVSDLGTERGEGKDLGEVSRGQQSISYIHEGHEEEPCVFIHEGHERHEEKILRKIGRDRLPRLYRCCGAAVMGVALRASSRLPHNDSTTPYGGPSLSLPKIASHKIALRA